MSDGPGRTPPSSAPARRLIRALPGSVWALGLVSMFMDTSSELVHSLLPVFMASTLGVGMAAIGLVEGIAEATAAIVKVFAGAISDYLGKRKLLVVLGYGLSGLTKPVFPLATSLVGVFIPRFTDRIGKGIRGAPRDALVADITPPELRGAAYGLRQSLDTVGAFVGPLLAVILMARFANDIRAVFWVAVVPALLAVIVLVVAVHEPKGVHHETGRRGPRFADARTMSRRYWLIVAVGAVFTLARFSEAFLVLRARDVGLALGYVPIVLIAMNLVYAAVAYPAGVATDRLGGRTPLLGGLVALVVADLVLAAASRPWHALVGAAIWGLHMGLTQGLLAKLVADTAPAELRGTAFGLFNLITGGVLLLASVIAGGLWSAFGPSAPFIAGAAFAAVAGLGAWWWNDRHGRRTANAGAEA